MKENIEIYKNIHISIRTIYDRGVFADQWRKKWIINNALGTVDYLFETI